MRIHFGEVLDLPGGSWALFLVFDLCLATGQQGKKSHQRQQRSIADQIDNANHRETQSTNLDKLEFPSQEKRAKQNHNAGDGALHDPQIGRAGMLRSQDEKDGKASQKHATHQGQPGDVLTDARPFFFDVPPVEKQQYHQAKNPPQRHHQHWRDLPHRGTGNNRMAAPHYRCHQEGE